jgi:hypothetical protein
MEEMTVGTMMTTTTTMMTVGMMAVMEMTMAMAMMTKRRQLGCSLVEIERPTPGVHLSFICPHASGSSDCRTRITRTRH